MRPIFILIIIFLQFSSLFADEIAISTFVAGKVFLLHDGKKSNLKKHQQIEKNDTVLTEKGKADIQIGKNSIIHLENNSKIKIIEFLENGEKSITNIESTEGKVFAKIIKPLNKESSFQIQSESHVAGVRGTEFIFSNENKPDSQSSTQEKEIPEGVFVNEGSVEVFNKESSVETDKQTSDSSNPQTINIEANEQVVFNGEMKKEILADFIKDKMKIFKTLSAMKEENYNLLKNQILNNKSMLKSVIEKSTDN